jgi:molecular chaperone GrpE (heat shock protein)
MPTMSKRSYKRRSEDERIAELESKIAELQKKVESKQRTDLPVLREIPKLQRKLKDFAQRAVNYGRDDLANSTMAFAMGLDRHLDEAGMSRNLPRKTAADQDDG